MSDGQVTYGDAANMDRKELRGAINFYKVLNKKDGKASYKELKEGIDDAI